ncbi:MAG: helix-turn-helix transcriptional regulator [Bacteroidetes bacterium]|nr:helix-turn-helix transcriptional regulator [Bacteroidota bacterium]
MPKSLKTKFELAVVNHVIQARKAKGLSQNDIAKILKLSRGFIGQVESPNSPSVYSLNHLNKLAYELQCSIRDFIPSSSIGD